MKAIVYKRYGSPDVLHLEDVNQPAPEENELLIKVEAASVNAYDWRHVRASPFFIRLMGAGLLRPKHTILGADVAGRVEAVGGKVERFKPGDEVLGDAGHGGFAEFVCVDESRVVEKPSGLSFEEAAAMPMAGLTALQGLRMGKIQAGQKVLINGASGGVGSFAVQVAKSYNNEVDGTCRPEKMDFVRSIGAGRVIDHTREDVTQGRQKYDLIFDTAAYRSVTKYKRILNPGGEYVLAGGSMVRFFQTMMIAKTGTKNMGIIGAKIVREDLLTLVELMTAGKVKSMIDRRFPLSQAADAVRYVEDGRACGKVVITVP